jgi:hypothetical protein
LHRDRAGPAAQPPAHLALLLRAIAVGATLVVRLPEIALQLVVEIALQLCVYICVLCLCVCRRAHPHAHTHRCVCQCTYACMDVATCECAHARTDACMLRVHKTPELHVGK